MQHMAWTIFSGAWEKILREKSLMAWAAKTDVTWFAVFESIYENPALRDETKDVLIKELEGTSELLIGSDKI